MTNRQWLETLTDEELLKNIHILCGVMHDGRCPEEVTCEACRLNWLNQQHKEEE